MKRLHIHTQSAAMDNLDEIDSDIYASSWQLEAERLESKRLRKFRRQMA